MGNQKSRFATDDPGLKKLLDKVMGNQKAASVFWQYLLGDSVDPFSLPYSQELRLDGNEFEAELGCMIDAALTREIDAYCIGMNISRFTLFLCAFSVVMEKYGESPDFYITHNYGVTGSENRILQYPVTRVQIGTEDEKMSFRQLCIVQNELIQKSSYHLCLPALPIPEKNDVDRTLAVFLTDSSTGHTRESIIGALQKCKLALIVELVDETAIMARLHFNKYMLPREFAAQIYEQTIHALGKCIEGSDWLDARDIATVPASQEPELLNQSVFTGAETVEFPELRFSLHDLVMKQAERTPERIAVKQIDPSDRGLTYKQLVESSENLAERIKYRFDMPREGTAKVGLLLNRGINQVIAVMGILMAGCAYVPMDPEQHPPERIEFILRDSGAIGLISESKIPAARCFYSKLPVIAIDQSEDIEGAAAEDCRVPLDSSEAIAYVIYTSGSTGQPKGVLVPHRGVVNDIFCIYRKYLRSNESIISNVLLSTNLCFDAHVDELFLPLAFGGTITCLTTSIAQTQLDASWNLTFVQSTPSVLQVISIPDSVKCVLIGGETLTRACLENVVKPGRIVLNGYGPTETTNESSIHIVRNSADFKSIGWPIWNTNFYILDRSGTNLVPKHAWGELFIGGLGVTRGYLNLPELTQQVFIPSHPACAGERVYRTGDIVRINIEGELEFKGRKHSCGQIKLRGYRIELGEVQYAIVSNNRSSVKEAHVMVVKDQIIAYVTPDTVVASALCYGQLPEYMKPSLVVPLKAFPRNISGKLDLKRLASMSFSQQQGRESVCDPGVAQGVISSLQETLPEVLEADRDTNFFSVGGNSLNVISFRKKLIETFQLKEIDIKLQILLQLQTVGKISAFIESILGIGTDVSHKNPDAILVPLSRSISQGVPFFCVHAAGGQVHTYSLLANALTRKTASIAFYAIQDPSLTLGASHRLNSFEALGALYAKRINDFYKSGPVFLGGHSSGGFVAFETAKSLEQDFGRKIGHVFLIDSECRKPEDSLAFCDPQINVIERLDELRH